MNTIFRGPGIYNNTIFNNKKTCDTVSGPISKESFFDLIERENRKIITMTLTSKRSVVNKLKCANLSIMRALCSPTWAERV